MKKEIENFEIIKTKMQFLRKQKNWSLAKTAKKLEVPASTYRDWEKSGKISAGGLLRVADVYHVSLSFFSGKLDVNQEKVKKAIYYMDAALEELKSV